MARIEQGEKARKEVAKPSNPKLRLRTRLMETVNRIFTSKQEKLSDQKELLRGMSRRQMLALSAAAIVAACAPLPAAAQDTTPAKGKEVAAVEEKSEIEYNILTDVSELEPYLKNAKGKIIELEHRKTEKIGEYLVTAEKSSGVGFSIESLDGTYKKRDIPFVSPMKYVNVLVIDLGENHPSVGSKVLVFADYGIVYFQYFDKLTNKHTLTPVSLLNIKGGIKRGPINIGYGIDDDGVFVITAPKEIKPGDIIGQAGIWNDGTCSATWFKYIPEREPKQVAMK